jgi:hypothetical protein
VTFSNPSSSQALGCALLRSPHDARALRARRDRHSAPTGSLRDEVAGRYVVDGSVWALGPSDRIAPARGRMGAGVTVWYGMLWYGAPPTPSTAIVVTRWWQLDRAPAEHAQTVCLRGWHLTGGASCRSHAMQRRLSAEVVNRRSSQLTQGGLVTGDALFRSCSL